MLIKTLQCHQHKLRISDISLQVAVDCKNRNQIALCYRLSGDISQILLPKVEPSQQADNLWQHTCFECFIAVDQVTGYKEFNFSPSGLWAIYAFSDYRQQQDMTVTHRPALQVNCTNELLELSVQIDHINLPSNPEHKPIQLGLSAVLEDNNQQLSYWALHHPCEQPDFHHRSGFCCEINMSESPTF